MVIQQEQMIAKTDIAGLIIAGGTSKRFGSDKYKAELLGKSLLSLSVDNLEPHVAEIIVNLPNGHTSPNYQLVQENQGLGPLSAVVSGMKWAREHGYKWLLTTPVDVPILPRGLIEALKVKGGGAYSEADDGPHGLCALWAVKDMEAIQNLLETGKRAVSGAHKILGNNAVFYPAKTKADYFNINTEADLQLLKTLLE